MSQEEQENRFQQQLERLLTRLEALRIAEYVRLLEKPQRLLWVHFWAGIARGLGIAIGASLVFAVMMEVLRKMIMLHLPLIGNVIADIVRFVEQKNGGF